MANLTITPVNDIAEGVYMASGAESDCFEVLNVTGPENWTGDEKTWIFTISVRHNADHTSKGQIVTLTFNQPVTHNSSPFEALTGGDGTNTLTYRSKLAFGDNETKGDIYVHVVSEPGVKVTYVSFAEDWADGDYYEN